MRIHTYEWFSVSAGVGVFIGLVEVIMVVIACMYSVQIDRKRREVKMFTRVATANDEEAMPSLTSDYSSLPFHKT